jgi:hydroxymethylpyrimidine/phosphomethylpyrimidine kinase
VKSVLTIAGSDSSGGAGIQADLKAFAAAGLHGASVLTAVTAQNTSGVEAIHPVPPDMVEAQLEAVLTDLEIGAAKTGMLYSAEVVDIVARCVKGRGFPLVVDPVMVAAVGASLAREGFVEALEKRLLPLTTVVTPNVHEAEVLAKKSVTDQASVEEACRRIHSLGPQFVLLKGGHLPGPAVDVLFDGSRFSRFEGPRLEKELHGSGCVLSAFIAAHLALGKDVPTAVARAKRQVILGHQCHYAYGKGMEAIAAQVPEDRFAVWRAVQRGVLELTEFLPPEMVPEVGINLGYALPFPQSTEDVCALRGRIMSVGGKVTATGYPDFGASRHVARIILAASRADPGVLCAANLKFTDQSLRCVRELGLTSSTFDRTTEPEGVSTMEWGTTEAIKAHGGVPDVIWDRGGIGKEAMIRVLGGDPRDVVDKIRSMAMG